MLYPNISVQEEDPNNPIDPDWLDLSLSEEVLALEDKLPANLKSVKDEEVRAKLLYSDIDTIVAQYYKL